MALSIETWQSIAQAELAVELYGQEEEELGFIHFFKWQCKHRQISMTTSCPDLALCAGHVSWEGQPEGEQGLSTHGTPSFNEANYRLVGHLSLQ